MIKLSELLSEKNMTPAQKEFAALAPPKDKITYADKIAGAQKKKELKKEGHDHEVSMATSSLKSIIKSSVTLLNKLGNMERDIPGWIQDHITNAENYIDQAAQGFHELHDNE